MFPASTKGGGNCLGVPDVCMTPAAPSPIPTPYPNTAMCNQGSGSGKVKFNGKEVLRKGDEIRMSQGDEAGNSPGGTISGRFKGPCKYKMGCSKVKAEGKEVARLTSMIGHNGSNPNMPAGTQIAPSQTKVKVFP
ncbi:MAG: DUF4150 domain-containing protein [Kiritimatiellae bacterium]|nr:DUF4150 domain-containing protein [Kiritimatiellia bacterium]